MELPVELALDLPPEDGGHGNRSIVSSNIVWPADTKVDDGKNVKLGWLVQGHVIGVAIASCGSGKSDSCKAKKSCGFEKHHCSGLN